MTGMRDIDAPHIDASCAATPAIAPASGGDGCAWRPAGGDVGGLLAALRGGIAVLPRDLTPSRMRALRAQMSHAEAAATPAPPVVIAAWLKKLAPLVANPPPPAAVVARTAAIAEVCADIPLGAWTPETRIAWCRQPPRDGYPIGARWPAPGELHALLYPTAQRIHAERHALRRLLAMGGGT
ncbi:hypothetical protein NJLHNGOC_07095 [Novacetimonas cocois]|uniref:Uncharacterized protein n=2 Tax=Novacetimonas cocois TaxID=1747507 RepID=A0A365YZ99_9PROT|nr:hypothetical protein NJLHNGOC_07095 [Novacetimonas cocois]